MSILNSIGSKMLKELVTHIKNLTGYTIGSDLLAGRSTTAGAETALIVEELTPGIASTLRTDERFLTFRIVSRSRDYFTARDRAYTTHGVLHGKWHVLFPVVTSGELWEGSLDCTTPYHIGQDERGLEMFCFNCSIKARNPD